MLTFSFMCLPRKLNQEEIFLYTAELHYSKMNYVSNTLTLSTMKSIASAILESTGPLAKFPRTIFFNMKAGINQKLLNRNMETNMNNECPHWKENPCWNHEKSPVCCPCLIKDGGITEWITQYQWVHSGRLVCALCKLLSQESTQRCPEQMNLKVQVTDVNIRKK